MQYLVPRVALATIARVNDADVDRWRMANPSAPVEDDYGIEYTDDYVRCFELVQPLTQEVIAFAKWLGFDPCDGLGVNREWISRWRAQLYSDVMIARSQQAMGRCVSESVSRSRSEKRVQQD